MAPFFRHNDPASPPAAHKPTALCPRLPLRPLPSARLARPSLLPFIPPLPGPGRPAESLAWRCVAGALLGFGNKNTRVNRAVCLQPCEIILAISPWPFPTSPILWTKTRTDHPPATTAPHQQNRISEVRSFSSVVRKSSHRLTSSPFTGHMDFAVISIRSVDKAH